MLLDTVALPAEVAPFFTRPFRFGIGARLVTAFIVVVGLAVCACLVGWLSYVSLAGELAQIAQLQIPRLAFATRLSQAGADINSVMPNLASAPSRKIYSDIRRVYAERLDKLGRVLVEMGNNGGKNDALTPLATAITRNLAQIDVVAGKRFSLIEEIRSDVDELRWVQADLFSEAEPLVDDARFNMETEARTLAREAPLLDEQRKSEALLTLVAQANLATGLIGRLADIGSADDMQDTIAFLGDSTDQLMASQRVLADWPDSITVRQLADQILSRANIQSGLPNVKRSELMEARKVQELAAENRRLVEELGEKIRVEVVTAESGAQDASVRAKVSINTGSKLLLAIAVLAVSIALLVGYLYVHRNLLTRIRLLAKVASNISAGRSSAPITVSSHDELGDLAHALNIFRQTRDELIQSAKLAALGQMAAGIGHELNQPLAAIRAQSHNATVLIERGEEQRALRNISKINFLAVRMGDQISHLRRFARRPDSRLGPVELAATVADAISLLAHRFEDEGVRLEIAIPQEPKLHVLAESVRLEQVIVNLVANALDAVAGRATRGITISAKATGQFVELFVDDTGAGISRLEIDTVFDPFFTTKPVGSGLGLGLSISYNIVKDFNGVISVLRSSPDGTTFLVSLRAALV